MPMPSMASKRQKVTRFPRRQFTDLPQDIVVSEIMTKLPVKSLLRFRCVSKTWHGLISSPDFAKSHLRSQKNEENKILTFSIAINQKQIHLSVFPIIHNKKPSNKLVGEQEIYVHRTRRLAQVPEGAFMFLGSMNGLLCFRGLGQKVIVWNPCTGKMKRVDDAPCSQYFNVFGFGFDKNNCDYKVVYALRTANYMDHDLWVYSFRSGAWENIRRGFRTGIVIPNIGVNLSGTLNWCTNTMRECDGWKWKILSFNLTTSTATTMLLPDHVLGCAVYIGQSRGFLLASRVYNGEMSVWQMNEFGDEKSWTKLASFSDLPKPTMASLLSDPLFVVSNFLALLYVSKNGDVVLKVAEYLKVFGSKIKSRKINLARPSHGWFKPISFLETLVSPPGLSDDE